MSAKGALDLCVNQMKIVLSSQQLPENATMETIGRAYHATETFVQVCTSHFFGNYEIFVCNYTTTNKAMIFLKKKKKKKKKKGVKGVGDNRRR